MAVTVEDIAVALRLSADGTGLTTAQTTLLTRLQGVGESHVQLLIETAPDAIKDECVVRMASYLFDQPLGRRDAFANAWINSGAGSLASKWHLQAASGSADSPTSAGVDAEAVLALISTHPLDDAAVAALIETHAEISEAHHRRSSSAGIVNVENGRLASSAGTVMRIGWSDSQAYDELVYTRDGNHPGDGAAVGTIAGVFPPVQPASIPDIPDVAANEKYLHIWVGEIPGNVAQLTFFGTPAHGMSAAAAQTYNTTEGTWWVSNLPLSPGISAYAFSATVVGALIASQSYVDAAIAALPAPSGGFPSTRTEVLSATASSTNQTIQASEAWLPNHLYEVTVGAWARHLFMTVESGKEYAIAYPVPDQALDLAAVPVDAPYFLCVITIGTTGVAAFSFREQTGSITIPIKIHKIT